MENQESQVIEANNQPLVATSIVDVARVGVVPVAPAQREVAVRWFAERLAFVSTLSLGIAIAVGIATGNPVGLFMGPLGVFSIYWTASWLFGVGRMKRPAFVDEPQFSWKLYFAESYKFVGILLAAMLAAGLVNLARSCGR